MLTAGAGVHSAPLILVVGPSQRHPPWGWDHIPSAAPSVVVASHMAIFTQAVAEPLQVSGLEGFWSCPNPVGASMHHRFNLWVQWG